MELTKEQKHWNALSRKALSLRFLGQALLLGFLTVITMPVILPFLWLLTTSVTDSSRGIDSAIIWQTLALLVPTILALGFVNSYFPDFPYRKIINIAILLVLLTGLYWLFRTKFFPANYNIFSARAAATLTRDGEYPPVGIPLLNSLAMALGVTVLVIIVSTLAGYYISRFNFKGRKLFLQGLIILHSFPAHSLTIPIFLLSFWLGLLDKNITVVFVLTALQLPFSIYIIKGFFDSVPWSIEMSAMTDGATRLQAFHKVVVPTVKNGILAIGVFAFIRGWGEYIFVSTLIISSQSWMMSTYLYTIADETKDVNYGLLAAASVVYLVPTVIMYVLAQKQLSQLNISGTKG